MKKRIRKAPFAGIVAIASLFVLFACGFIFGWLMDEAFTPPYRFERDACTHVANGAGETAFICGRVDKP